MTEYRVVIHSKVDEAEGREMFPELNEEPCTLTVAGVGIIEGGMASGAPSMMLLLDDADGQHHKVYLSCNAFLTIGGAVKGAMGRFGFEWTGA